MGLTKAQTRTLSLFGFVFPALSLYSLFVLAPTFGGIWYSLTDWNGLNPTYHMVGFSNYVEALTDDPVFLQALWFTLKFVIAMVVLQNALALAIALLIEARRRGRSLFRTVFFMPNMMSMIIGGFMWLFVFAQVLPTIAQHPPLGFLDVDWLGDPHYAFLAILVVSLWGGVGYLMVIYIAALQGVPRQLREAAAVDGANAVQIFRNVTLPLILPAVTIGIFLALNSSFKVFDVVYALTGGGPGRATQVIALNIFEEAFKDSNRYGYASAKAMILFAIVFLVTLVQLWIMKRNELEA